LTDFSSTLSPADPRLINSQTNLSKLLQSRSKSLKTPILYVEYERKNLLITGKKDSISLLDFRFFNQGFLDGGGGGLHCCTVPPAMGAAERGCS
jgi:hypothetical protein